jgi:hypothetical protein
MLIHRTGTKPPWWNVFRYLLVAVIVSVVPSQEVRASSDDVFSEAARSAESWDQALLLVVDRNRVEDGETVGLTVLLARGRFAEAKPEVYAAGALSVSEVSGSDSEHVRRYRIAVSKPGEYSVVVRTAIKPEGGEAVPVRVVIRNVLLTVSRKEGGIVALNSRVVIGAIALIFGSVSSLFGLYSKQVVEGWTARRNQVGWLSNELVGRLEAARGDVRRRRTANYQPWMDELYSKYFSALRRWPGEPRVGESLTQEMIEIEGLLRQYNDSLSKVSTDEGFAKDLDHRIVAVQRILSGQ